MHEFRSQIFGGKKSGKKLLGSKRSRSARGADGLMKVTIPREAVRTTDTRGAGDRHRLAGHKATAIHRRRKHEVELVNLSGGGAMIAGKLEPNLWDRIDLDFGDTGRIEAAVRWVKDGRIGLEFAHETRIDCSPAKRAKLLREVIERSFPDLAVQMTCAVPPEMETAETPEPGPDNRSEPRHPLIWSGTVQFGHHEASVRLRNISSRGALIESDITLHPDATLTLDLGEAGSVAATVSWAAGDQAGLLFESEFDVQRLAASKPKVTPFEWDCPTYLRNAAKGSPWDKGWKRASMEELKSALDGYMKY